VRVFPPCSFLVHVSYHLSFFFFSCPVSASTPGTDFSVKALFSGPFSFPVDTWERPLKRGCVDVAWFFSALPKLPTDRFGYDLVAATPLGGVVPVSFFSPFPEWKGGVTFEGDLQLLCPDLCLSFFL